MSLAMSVKNTLEQTYDIPFTVNGGLNGKDPWLSISPTNDNQSLFTLHMEFRNNVRLIVTVEPQKYAANMVTAMGQATSTQQNMFVSFAELIQRDSGKITLSVNGNELSPNNCNEWPSLWTKLMVRISVFPLELDGDEDYCRFANQWATQSMGLILSLLDIVPLEEDEGATVSGYKEGSAKRQESNRYERNPLNRQICLQHRGYTCAVCGFNFEERYGLLGKEFIHVHHIVPVSAMGDNYVVRPLLDLVPVCPNCHAMLHRSNPPMPVETLREIICK